MGSIDDLSLKVIDEDFKNIQQEMSHMRVAILQMLCLERLHKEEEDNDKWPNIIIDGKEFKKEDKTESFQNRK